MFTICLFWFASVTAVEPFNAECTPATQADITAHVTACRSIDRDPLMMCEAQRMGALKMFFRIRKLEGT